MKEPTNSGIDALLDAARASYAARLPSKVAEISALATRGEWHEIRRAAHKLRGSAATYGFAELGLAVGRIEDVLLSTEGAPNDGVRVRIDGLLRAAEALARDAAPCKEGA